MIGEDCPTFEPATTKHLTNDYVQQKLVKILKRGEEERSRERIMKRDQYKPPTMVMLEFVAIPPNFDIVSYLGLREQVGISRYSGIELEQVKILAETVKHSPVLALLNNKAMSCSPCLYLLSILEELELVVRSINNPIRKMFSEYKNYLKVNADPRNRSFDVNLIVINIFPLMGDDIIQESLRIAEKLQIYQDELDESIAKVPILDSE
jgi:hypothetical protein